MQSTHLHPSALLARVLCSEGRRNRIHGKLVRLRVGSVYKDVATGDTPKLAVTQADFSYLARDTGMGILLFQALHSP